MRYSRSLLVFLAAALSACSLNGGVQVRKIASGATPPAHVASVISVTKQGQPVTTLRTSAFRISDNEQLLDPQTIDLRLLPPDEVISFHTVLLMDMGPGLTAEGRKLLSLSLTKFVEKLTARQSITVYAFDGGKILRLIGEFSQDPLGKSPSIAANRFAAPTDSSRNLRGAVVEALERLESKRKQHLQPIKLGNLVVFAAGQDLANRLGSSEFEEQLGKTTHHLYFVGLKGDADNDDVQALSRHGQALSPDIAHVPEAFEQMVSQLTADMDSYYVLSYCSLARAGEQRSRIEVDVVNDELEVETGRVEFDFNAKGFTTGCEASSLPKMTVFREIAK
jgi:hypothetical protein